MSIEVLRLWNVRNYLESEFRPTETTTLIWGANGAGKTTLLEAIGLFATLSSPRAAHVSVLVSHDAPHAGMKLEPTQGSDLEIRISGGRTSLRAGGAGVAAKTFLGRFRAVLFGPEDLDLVRGEPGLRRRAVDDLIVQMRPAYRKIRQDFDRALRQRNAALRQGLGNEAIIFNAGLATTAAEVIDSRRSAVASIGPAATLLYGELAGAGKLEISYVTNTAELNGQDLVEHLMTTYESELEIDLERATTRTGPHRDDVEFVLDGFSARAYSSRGEQRTMALAVRLAELELLPGAVLLLDDVMSELDPERRQRVFKAVSGVQMIVTATESDTVPDLADVAEVWSVVEGILRQT